jgi:hypothetical protein
MQELYLLAASEIGNLHRELSFASLYFILLFVPVACVAVYIAQRISRRFFTYTLIAISIAFYVSWGPNSFLVLAASIGLNWTFRG